MATKYPRTGFNPMSQKPLAARHADRHSAGLAVRFVATFRQSLIANPVPDDAMSQPELAFSFC
jgi:hypothetical protein